MRFKERERERMGEIFLKRVENDIYNRDRENTSVCGREENYRTTQTKTD